jgi:hypothetical protein
MHPSRIQRDELIAVVGGLVLAAGLFLTWYKLGNNHAELNQFKDHPGLKVTGWQALKFIRYLLLAAAATPIILTYIVLRGHKLGDRADARDRARDHHQAGRAERRDLAGDRLSRHVDRRLCHAHLVRLPPREGRRHRPQAARSLLSPDSPDTPAADGREAPTRPDRNLALELVRVTEAAALAAATLVGAGDKEAADQAAVDAMRYVLDSVPMDGIVVIGEGEKDEAPMLFNGEEIGDGSPPRVDIAVDPLEGTRLTALG